MVGIRTGLDRTSLRRLQCRECVRCMGESEMQSIHPPFYVHTASSIAQPAPRASTSAKAPPTPVMLFAGGVDRLREAIKAKERAASSDYDRIRELESEVVGPPPQSTDPRHVPNNEELLAHGCNALETAAGVADVMGAESTADLMRKTARVGRTVPAAVRGVVREVQPVKEAATGLWSALEKRGIVGMRERVNIAELQGRERGKRAK